LPLLKQKQDEANKAFQRGDISTAEYKKVELSVLKAENEVKALNAEIQKTQKLKVDSVAAGFDKLTAGLGKALAAAATAEGLIASGLTAEIQRAQTAEQANATAAQNETTRAQTAEAAKVDKVTGKGLSTDDYTSAEKTKLASLEKSHAKTTTEYGAASKTAYGHAKFYCNANGDSTEFLSNPTYEHYYNSAFDCNDYRTAGRVYQNHARSGAGATQNGPIGNTTDKFALEVYAIPGDSAAVLQRYVSIINNREFVRKYNGTWIDWQEFAFKADITTDAATETMNYKGVWSATATYKKGDVVVGDTGVSGIDALSTWVSLADNNTNHTPPNNASDSYWRIIGSYCASGFIGRCRYPEVYIVGSSETSLSKIRGLILTDTTRTIKKAFGTRSRFCARQSGK
jgi:hypothetical protein